MSERKDVFMRYIEVEWYCPDCDRCYTTRESSISYDEGEPYIDGNCPETGKPYRIWL